ncbi:MAG: thiolase family protein, partial [Deltaproteobacteria bacterium]|nr:thiolase family protein [Candidatus Deferrimicrobiaceae bacterium]
MKEAWIIDAIRTPIGKHGGSLSQVRPDDLAAVALKALLERTKVPASEVEDVYMGCANQAGEDNRNVGRMALLLAGFPLDVPGCTVNRLCGSGLEAVANAARAVMLGEADVYIGAGVESMTRAPWAMPKAEAGYPRGNVTVFDTSLGWRFTNPRLEQMGHTDSLGMTAENLAEMYGISREEQDRFAFRSQKKAAAAIDAGAFKGEIVPVQTRKALFDTDEGPRRDTSLEKLASLSPAFKKGGTVTAGNSSTLNDGAAAVLVTSKEYARAHGLAPLAKVRSIGVAGVPPRIMGFGPVPAAQKALERAGIAMGDIGLIELNEAFASQSLAVFKGWGMDFEDDRVNVNGGAIALGHPLGCSGVRLLTTLVHELRRRPEVQFGLATM